MQLGGFRMKINNLDYNERLLLSLYAEFYYKYYDYYDNQKKDNTLIRYLEMQHLAFLIPEFGIYRPEYSFSWNGYCPYSIKLEEDLGKLDKKKKEILLFYKDYEEVRNFNRDIGYHERLRGLFSRYLLDRQIDNMEGAFYLLKDDVNDEKSANLMASILYAKDKMMLCGNPDLKSILEFLDKYAKTEIDYNLAQKIWKYLGVLGIIETQYYQPIKNSKILTRERKL